MNTLDDLRSSLDRHAGQAPDAFGLVEQAQSGAGRIRRRRGILRAGVAAAAVLIVVAGAPAVLRHRDSGTPVGAPEYHRTPSQLTLETAAGSGITLRSVHSLGPVQLAYAYTAGSPAEGTQRLVTVNDPGSFDSKDLKGGRRMAVGGQPAWFVTDYRPDGDGLAQTVLSWQDPSGAWLTVSPSLGTHLVGTVTVDQQTMQDLETIAAGLRIGPARDYPMPYRLGWLPPGVQVERVSSAPQSPDWQAWVELSTDREPRTDVPGWNRPTVSVRIDTRSTADRNWAEARDALGGKKTTVAGHPAWYRAKSGQPPQSLLAVEIGSCGFTISVARSTVSYPELERLVGAMTVANCADPKTWGPLR